MVNISPNYLNAVENGKNFPSPEIIQQISHSLEVLPYQLFLEHPSDPVPLHTDTIIPELIKIKQLFIKEINDLIQKYQNEANNPQSQQLKSQE